MFSDIPNEASFQLKSELLHKGNKGFFFPQTFKIPEKSFRMNHKLSADLEKFLLMDNISICSNLSALLMLIRTLK